MHDAKTIQIGTLLANIADELDISQELYDEMVRKYEHLGEWIRNDNEDRLRTILKSTRRGLPGSAQ